MNRRCRGSTRICSPIPTRLPYKLMTILQLISSEGYYGAENMLVTLSKSLLRLGCKLFVAVFRDARNPHVEVCKFAAGEGLAVRIVPCSGRWDWNSVFTIGMLIEDCGV